MTTDDILDDEISEKDLSNTTENKYGIHVKNSPCSNDFSKDVLPVDAHVKALEDQEWELVSWARCTFQTEHFVTVMHNLIKNPNIMSSHLFRADIIYDSATDKSVSLHEGPSTPLSTLTPHFKPDCQPCSFSLPGFEWQKSIVRQLIPRNRQLDPSMNQTCHVFQKACTATETTTTVTIYLPHVKDAGSFPFYHPKVKGICFVHTSSFHSSSSSPSFSNPSLCSKHDSCSSVGVNKGLFRIYIHPFPTPPTSSTVTSSPSLQSELSIPDVKLQRTLLRLSTIILKHSYGQSNGYQKRVHHDLIVPQREYQNTYSRLKETYANKLVSDWREETDAIKHVFEDLAIAAFLIEFWRGEYAILPLCERRGGEGKGRFPGFVDVGCGNGLLVYLLSLEGYDGFGIDGRKRKSWEMYTEDIMKDRLKEKIIVPWILNARRDEKMVEERLIDDGRFDEGTFIISNHADELSLWTPLLAFLNNSPFVAIPCCSHDFTGMRFRAPRVLRSNGRVHKKSNTDSNVGQDDQIQEKEQSDKQRNGAESGSLKDLRNEQAGTGKKGQVSAYASLCEYITLVSKQVDYNVEREMLRIPSTRNACILGRPKISTENQTLTLEQKEDHVRKLLIDQTGLEISAISTEWLTRAGLIVSKKGNCH